MARSTARPRRSWKKTLLWLIGIAAVLFVLIQFIPYGRTSHTNPPATNAFRWTDPKAEAIARVSCYDCHSNETKWWWATNIAPFSWLVQHDVDSGRARLNFSEFTGEPSAARLEEAVNDQMPPFQYTLIHRNAKLTDAEKQTLVQGYRAGIAASSGSSSSGSSSGNQPSATPSATAAASGDGAAIVNSQCSNCHQAPVGYHAGSAAEAQALIDNMIQQGAQVTPAQEQTLIQYFTQ